MKSLSNSDKLKALIAPNMTDLITFIENNGRFSVYTRVNTHGLYHYREIIGSPTTLTTSVQISRHFGPSSSTNNDTETLQPVIAALHMIQKSIFECCGRIGHKSDDCIICGPRFLLPILIIKMNQLNALCGDEPTNPPREWNS